MSTDCGHGWRSKSDCDTCTLERVYLADTDPVE